MNCLAAYLNSHHKLFGSEPPDDWRVSGSANQHLKIMWLGTPAIFVQVYENGSKCITESKIFFLLIIRKY